MSKEYNKNTINQAETTKMPKVGTKAWREWQKAHDAGRKASFNRGKKKKKHTTLKEIYELDQTYSIRKEPLYSIKLSISPSNVPSEPLYDIDINNIPDRYAFEEIETGNPRKVVRKFARFTIVSEKIGGYAPPRRAAPPKNKYKSYTYIMKPFSEFTQLDWYLWHKADEKARGVYWAESNRRDKQRAKGKPWDKYYRKSSQSSVQAPVQSQSKKNIINNNQNMHLLLEKALGFA